MSLLSYNGVFLPYSTATQFDQRALRDESDTDWYLTEFNIKAQCVVNKNYLGLLAPDLAPGGVPVTDNAAAIMAAIRTRLMQHRRRLSFTFNGVELIPQPQQGVPGTVDAQNGPKPQSCQIVQLTNVTFLIVYHIIARYWESGGSTTPTGDPINPNLPGNPVLYNRWSETLEFDPCQYGKRTRSGKFVIRSDNFDGFVADQVRSQMAVVGVPQGFLRESSSYTVDPSGLGIMYQIVDKEVYKMPPSPAFTADGDYYETVTRTGAKRFGEVRIRLRGAKETDQSKLIETAIGTASAKMRFRVNQLIGLIDNSGGPQDPSYVLESAGLRVKLYDNDVEFHMRAMIAANNLRVDAIAAFQGVDLNDPDSEDADFVPNYTPPYSDRGAAAAGGMMLEAAAYYDPSVRNVALGKGTGQLGTLSQAGGLVPGQAGKTPEP